MASTSYTSGDTPTPTPASTSTGTPPTTATTFPPSSARVRFDAECVLIPDLGLGAGGSKRPCMVTKSYSLPLWRKAGHNEEEDAHAHVVLKVALPRSVFFLSFTLLHLPPFSFIDFILFLPLPSFILSFFYGCPSLLAGTSPRSPPSLPPHIPDPNHTTHHGAMPKSRLPHGDVSVSRHRLVRRLRTALRGMRARRTCVSRVTGCWHGVRCAGIARAQWSEVVTEAEYSGVAMAPYMAEA
ncbi:hypothetical protein DFH06DRAFT_1331708 [Mycena polygramma]|nr:hypothetical protein DFH06DRAFT_1331708 [Mycena polygramma]